MRGAIVDLFLSPDRKALYALDVSEGAVYRINPDTLKIDKRVDAARNAVAMCLSPNGKRLYVGGREPWGSKGFGRIQIITTSDMKTQSLFEIPCRVFDVAATDDGRIVATSIDEKTSFCVIDPRKKKIRETVPIIPKNSFLRLLPAQSRVITSQRTPSGWSAFGTVNLKSKMRGVLDAHGSRLDNEDGRAGGGEIELTPDGKRIITTQGGVFRLSSNRDLDFRLEAGIEPGTAIGIAPGTRTFVVATREGFLKVYDLGTLELVKSVDMGFICTRLIVDPPAGRMFAIAMSHWKAGGNPIGILAVGSLITISLEGE